MAGIEKKKTVIIVQGMRRSNQFLQPWRYVSEVAMQLQANGHTIVLLTDGSSTQDGLNIPGISVQILPSVRNTAFIGNPRLHKTIDDLDPSLIIWGMGLTSLLHQDFPRRRNCRQVGIFSSPIYSFTDLIRLGFDKLLSNVSLSAIHLMGAMLPRWLLKARARQFGLDHIVTQTQTTRKALQGQCGLETIRAIPPGIDEIWFTSRSQSHSSHPGGQETVLTYMGPPDPLRGLPALLNVFARLHLKFKSLRLVALVRGTGRDHQRQIARLHRQIEDLEIMGSVELVDKISDRATIVEHCIQSDIIVLPFEIIPSDAPLSVLEVRALGKPLVTSRLGCLPELSFGPNTYFSEPANRRSLEGALLTAIEEIGRQGQVDTGHQLVAHRTWKDVGAEWLDLLEAL